MLRKHKLFRKPRKSFDTVRIEQENSIVAQYGLKNRREIWKAQAKLNSIRNMAKKFFDDTEENQKKFLDKLAKMGLKVEKITDVLALTEKEILDRRLQTIVHKKGIATTIKGARQLITHKHITISGKIVNIPSYMVKTDEEDGIDVVLKQKRKAIGEGVEEKAGEESKQVEVEVTA